MPPSSSSACSFPSLEQLCSAPSLVPVVRQAYGWGTPTAKSGCSEQVRLDKAPWRSCRGPCSLQDSWSRWPLRCLPTQGILWFYKVGCWQMWRTRRVKQKDWLERSNICLRLGAQSFPISVIGLNPGMAPKLWGKECQRRKLRKGKRRSWEIEGNLQGIRERNNKGDWVAVMWHLERNLQLQALTFVSSQELIMKELSSFWQNYKSNLQV